MVIIDMKSISLIGIALFIGAVPASASWNWSTGDLPNNGDTHSASSGTFTFGDLQYSDGSVAPYIPPTGNFTVTYSTSDGSAIDWVRESYTTGTNLHWLQGTGYTPGAIIDVVVTYPEPIFDFSVTGTHGTSVLTTDAFDVTMEAFDALGTKLDQSTLPGVLYMDGYNPDSYTAAGDAVWSTPTAWSRLGFDGNAATTSLLSQRITIDTSNVGGGNGMFRLSFDGIVREVVPEPSAAIFLLCAAFGFSLRRSRP